MSEALSIPLDILEDLIVDESVEVDATLAQVQMFVNTSANDIKKLYAGCKSEGYVTPLFYTSCHISAFPETMTTRILNVCNHILFN